MAGICRRIYLSATRKSGGKTCISAGLLYALREAGQTIQPFKKGPDYIDPMWLARAAQRPCYNLDFNTQTIEEILATAGRGGDADWSLIEGNKGLFDGVSEDGSDSNAELARVLNAPVVLVLDCEGTTRGVAPLVLGYEQFDPNIRLAGAILNRIGGSRHEAKLVHALEQHTDLAVIGALGKSDDLQLLERHLGLVTCAEQSDAELHLARMGQAVADGVDLARLSELADGTMPIKSTESEPIDRPALRIGYARDAAFGFYYEDDLEQFAHHQARLVPFDTLHDTELPEIDGLWIGGGFPETQAAALSANIGMRESLRQAIELGMPTYAECGGLMYLCRKITYDGQTHDMAGVVAGDCTVHPRPCGRGLVKLKSTGKHPWPDVAAEQAVAAHEFHYSQLENLSGIDGWAWTVDRGTGIRDHLDGLIQGNLLASYSHLRHTHRFEWVRHFTDFVREKCPGTTP